MREPKKSEVPAEIPARSRDGRDENPAESKRAWEAFFAAVENAEGVVDVSVDNDDYVREEAA